MNTKKPVVVKWYSERWGYIEDYNGPPVCIEYWSSDARTKLFVLKGFRTDIRRNEYLHACINEILEVL